MKYLNAVLTVIAVCLVLITCAVTGVIPAAHAGNANKSVVSVPVNADGSLNVKLVKGETMSVSVDGLGGSRFYGHEFPITAKSPLDINIEEINGSSTFITPIRVKIEK